MALGILFGIKHMPQKWAKSSCRLEFPEDPISTKRKNTAGDEHSWKCVSNCSTQRIRNKNIWNHEILWIIKWTESSHLETDKNMIYWRFRAAAQNGSSVNTAEDVAQSCRWFDDTCLVWCLWQLAEFLVSIPTTFGKRSCTLYSLCIPTGKSFFFNLYPRFCFKPKLHHFDSGFFWQDGHFQQTTVTDGITVCKQKSASFSKATFRLHFDNFVHFIIHSIWVKYFCSVSDG